VTVTSKRLGGNAGYSVHVHTNSPRAMVLHWAIDDWKPADLSVAPSGTNKVDDKACQTRFEGGRSVTLVFPPDKAPERVVSYEKGGGCFRVWELALLFRFEIWAGRKRSAALQ
jgi:hypothetical protein